jgi:hypothetical protein
MISNITLPPHFFPATQVVLDYSSVDETYPITIFGFDGNELYQERTNIYLMRDEEHINSIADIGEYLCNILTLQDED